MLSNLKTILDETEIPVAYNHFNQATEPPFITFYRVSNSNVMADDSVYKKIENVNVELYTSKKDVELENSLETIFDNHKITYNVISENYLNDEKLYEIIYEINY